MSELINFYTLPSVKALEKKTHNPNYAQHGIKLHFRMLIVGASGSGKTNIVMNLLKLMEMTFNKVYLYTRNKDEPLYNYLEMAIPDKEFLEIHEGLSHFNSIDIDKHYFGQTLIIFDDLVQEKNQTKIIELFIRGRKVGVSIVYLTQKYSLVDTTIRENTNYLVLKKIAGKRDVLSILRNGSLHADKEELLNMYQFCVNGNDILSFLMIDLEAKQEYQFRLNFLHVLDINFFK